MLPNRREHDADGLTVQIRIERLPHGEGIDVRQLPGDHRHGAEQQAADQRHLEDAEARIEHLTDGLRAIRRIERIRHERSGRRSHSRMIRAMTTNHTTKHLLAQAVARLADHSESPQLDAELLLAHVLGRPRSRLKSHPEDVPDETTREPVMSGLIERRANGEPLAYLVGYKGFWTLELAVTPDVLVPRPETELIVERALELPLPDTARVVDHGHGLRRNRARHRERAAAIGK